MGITLLGNNKQGKLFILSAPAGTGKTTLVRMLTQEFPCVVASISSTTRAPRQGEVDGVDYHFITRTAFDDKVKAGEFLEHVELYGDCYGTSRSWVNKQLAEGKHVILVIDVQGARLLRDKVKAVTIFVSPPSLEELERRLKRRKTEDASVIEQRLLWAKKEMEARDGYDYQIVNDDLAVSYQILRSILIAEEHHNR